MIWLRGRCGIPKKCRYLSSTHLFCFLFFYIILAFCILHFLQHFNGILIYWVYIFVVCFVLMNPDKQYFVLKLCLFRNERMMDLSLSKEGYFLMNKGYSYVSDCMSSYLLHDIHATKILYCWWYTDIIHDIHDIYVNTLHDDNIIAWNNFY